MNLNNNIEPEVEQNLQDEQLTQISPLSELSLLLIFSFFSMQQKGSKWGCYKSTCFSSFVWGEDPPDHVPSEICRIPMTVCFPMGRV